MFNKLACLGSIALLLGCYSDTTPIYNTDNTEAQSGRLYFTFSVYEDENFQAIDETGKRVVAPDGKELFIRMSHFEEKVLQHLIGTGSPKLLAPQHWKSDVVKVKADYRLHLDNIVSVPLPDGGTSSGRKGWFVDLHDVSSAEWVELEH